ncbi:hypothetical protein RN001_011981 [Aquatica leii]|uniref:Osiris 8 n=1 Tax=Aquatica leii TaxID=1421715 RepID=A0AAN7P2D4_9COLE|nr:hypothetical protein RN001_011981 [Aquatica leii]
MILKYFVVVLLVSAAWARTSTSNLNEIPNEARSEESSNTYLGDLRYAYKVYKECASSDLSPCLKLKLVSAMDRALRSYSEVSLIDGVKFVKDVNAPAESAPKTEAELEASLPRGLDRENALNSLIVEKITNFFDTHSLQIKLPNASDIKRSLSDEGRGKKKKMGGVFLIPLLLGGTLIPLALGALALLAGKALIVSKIALVLAAALGLKKLLGGSNGGNQSGHEVVMAGPGNGGAWARSYDREQAQKLAYSAFAPKTTR